MLFGVLASSAHRHVFDTAETAAGITEEAVAPKPLNEVHGGVPETEVHKEEELLYAGQVLVRFLRHTGVQRSCSCVCACLCVMEEAEDWQIDRWGNFNRDGGAIFEPEGGGFAINAKISIVVSREDTLGRNKTDWQIGNVVLILRMRPPRPMTSYLDIPSPRIWSPLAIPSITRGCW